MKFSGLLVVIRVGVKQTKKFILEVWVAEQLRVQTGVGGDVY